MFTQDFKELLSALNEHRWSNVERMALSAHIEEGYLQAERGELINGEPARCEIQAMKDNWRATRARKG